MFDWYAPAIAEHYSPDDLRQMFDHNALTAEAALHPIAKPGYTDRKRRKEVGAYCFLLRKG